ncbi:MAG: STAS-like domain-containing protein [Bacteroides sp.]|nr:STAS-like domain-containing protein [Bacteroides sp.]
MIIKEYIDRYNDYAKAGDRLYTDARPLIDRGEKLNFDMIGLDAVSTVFLNASLGHLMDDYGIERVKKSFRFTNLLRSQADRIRKYFTDYEEVYQKA